MCLSPQIGGVYGIYVYLSSGGRTSLGREMKVNQLQIRKRSRRIAILLVLLFSLLVVVPVLADYLGPDRTVRIWVNQRRHCYYEAIYDPAGPGYDSCYLNLYVPPGSSCPSNVGSYFNPGVCGGSWPGYCSDPTISCSIRLVNSGLEGCSSGDTGCRSVEREVTYEPATVSGNITCPQTGDDNWCTAAASLSLSGYEPLGDDDYYIMALEGTHNGNIFACSGDSCTINLIEGGNAFTFWALSSWGDSSLMGNANRSVDTRPPSISGSVSGTPGNGVWYVSPVTISASASDHLPGSDVASFQASVDGGVWSDFSDPITLDDGNHTLDLLARDRAGWTDSESMTFQIDTIAPTTIFTDPTDTTWATGTISLSGASSDFNLESVEISYNGGGLWSGLSPDEVGNWSATWDTQTVSNGSYNVRARGFDEAGNVGAAATVTIMVDNGAPRIGIPDSWPIWQRVAIKVKDNGIGVKRVRLTIHSEEYGDRVYNWSSGPDDFKWDRRFGDILAPIGGYPVEVEAWDRVGNKGAAWGEIVIPTPDEVEHEEEPGVLSVEPPEEPSEPPSTSGDEEPIPLPTNTPESPKVTVFGESVEETAGEELTTLTGSDNLMVGSAAVSAISAVMAYILYTRRKRQEEEERMAKAAAQFNAQQRALEEYQNKKVAWWRAIQRAVELATIAASIASAGLTTVSLVNNYIITTEEPSYERRGVDAEPLCFYFEWQLTCYNIPTLFSGGELSTTRGITKISGKDLYQDYLKYHNDTSGWWWDVYGGDGNFTIWEYISLWALPEASQNWSQPEIPEAWIRKANEYCQNQNLTLGDRESCSDAGFVNWFAAWSQSAGSYITGDKELSDYDWYIENFALSETPFDSEDIAAISELADFIAHPPDEWDQGMSPYQPYGTSNVSTYYWLADELGFEGQYKKLLDWFREHQDSFIYFFNDQNNPWFIATGCTADYWFDSSKSYHDLEHDCTIPTPAPTPSTSSDPAT